LAYLNQILVYITIGPIEVPHSEISKLLESRGLPREWLVACVYIWPQVGLDDLSAREIPRELPMSPPVFVLLLVLPLDLSVRSLYVVVNQGLLKSFDELFSLSELFGTLGASLGLLLLLLDLLFDVDPLLEPGQAIISGEGIDYLDGINRSDTSDTHCVVRAHKEGHLDQVLPGQSQISLDDMHIILLHELISVKDVAVHLARAEKQGIRVFSDDTINQAYGFQISTLAFSLERSFHIGYPAELQQSLKFLEILLREKGESLGRPLQLLNEHDVLFKYLALHFL
jgi:hypothetical protein